MAIDPGRTIAELRELHELTGSAAGGAQRLAWSDGVGRARDWLDAKLAELPVEVTYDAAGNHWATLRGASERALVVGSHLDSVAGGGWLDGALGVLSGLEALRAIDERYDGAPPVTMRLVDWADEEGARFGRSLLGSSAAAGTLEPAELRGRVDSGGVAIEAAMAECGVEIERLADSGAELATMAAYLELHIEQGPVLEGRGTALAAVDGTCAAKRYRVRFEGEACHPAATPMAARRDALLACSRFLVGAHEIAARHEAMTSIGYLAPEPGHITIIAGACEMVIEQNHREGEVLGRVVAETQALAAEIAAAGPFELEIEPLWEIEPLDFDPELTALGEAQIAAVSGEEPFRMTSGPLHDAGEMARAGIPTTMLFVRSIGGISHNPAEDTDEADLALAIRALAGLADASLELIR